MVFNEITVRKLMLICIFYIKKSEKLGKSHSTYTFELVIISKSN